MWFLLGTTLTASFFDSLNPSAIAQQMLLQAMVKKKRHSVGLGQNTKIEKSAGKPVISRFEGF